jgi:arylsulfatase A-like enzyme
MPEPRNVVLLMTDQQHYRTLGCHGAAEARTPNLDRLAAGGIDFRQHIVTNPVCAPSRASLMTGKYITEHGLWANGVRLPEAGNVTLPQALGAAGFQTAHFGKLHLVPIINRTEKHPPYGFEVCEVSEGDQQLLDDEHFRWLRREDPDLFVRYVNEMFQKGHADGYKSLLPEERHLSTYVTDRAVDWLARRRRRDRPFFLSVGTFDPHHAFNPCEPYASMYDDIDVEPPAWRDDSLAARPAAYRRHFEGCKAVTRDPARITAVRRAYHAMVAHIDACVGRLVRALEQEGLARDTVVIFTSDHGELLGNHGLLWKGPYLLDDLMRVPMIVAPLAGRGGMGIACDEVTSGVDLMATVLALAGAAGGPVESGRRMVDADLNLLPDGPRGYALAEWEHPKAADNSSLRMIRTREHKLVLYNGSTEGELYDLSADPQEFTNRWSDPAYAAVRRRLIDQLAAVYLASRPRTPFEGAW